MSALVVTPLRADRLTLAARAAGYVGMTSALILLRLLPLRATITVLRLAARATPRTADVEHGEASLAAARNAGRCYPGRIACLEESVAAVLTAAIRRRRLTFCLGARFSPNAQHAWPQAGCTPLGQFDGEVWPYHALITVG